jgi:hypothetical protein
MEWRTENLDVRERGRQNDNVRVFVSRSFRCVSSTPIILGFKRSKHLFYLQARTMVSSPFKPGKFLAAIAVASAIAQTAAFSSQG